MDTNPLLVSSVESSDYTYTLDTPLELVKYWYSRKDVNERQQTWRGMTSGTDIKRVEYWEAFGNYFASIQSFFDSCDMDGITYATNGEHDGVFLTAMEYDLYGPSTWTAQRCHLADTFVVFTQESDCFDGVCDHELTDGKCLKASAFEVEFEHRELGLIN
jgi:hypothetical protein